MYSKILTDAIQQVWGEGFLSPGGPEEVEQMLRGLDLSGRRVLDIGSGLGGIDALLVEVHGAAEVVGIDVEAPLIQSATELISAKGLSERVKFQLVEPGPLHFPGESFDFVISKDAMVHVDDKTALYSEILRVLKPAGWLTAADWFWSEDAARSAIVGAWVSKLGLRFVYTRPEDARRALVEAGFEDSEVIDLRRELQVSNRREIAFLEGPDQQRLAKVVGQEEMEGRLASARGRQSALDSGDLIPCHLRGRRPR